MMSLFSPSKKELIVEHHRLEAPVKKPVHEAAVDFAQAVVELQQAKAQTEVDLRAVQAALAASQAENTALRTNLNETKSDLLYYHRRVIDIEAKFQVVASVITEVMRSSPIHPEDHDHATITDGREAVARALEGIEAEAAATEGQANAKT